MKKKFDGLDTACREMLFLKSCIECGIEALAEDDGKLTSEQKQKLANDAYAELDELETLVRKITRKGRVYRDIANHQNEGS